MSSVGDLDMAGRAVTRARARGGAAIGGGLDARSISQRYVRPALAVAEQLAPELREHTRRARRVLDAVGGSTRARMTGGAYLGGAYLGGGRRRVVGTKQEVWDGQAHHTAGGLTKSDLMLNKAGKVVSIRQHEAGRKALANLGTY